MEININDVRQKLEDPNTPESERMQAWSDLLDLIELTVSDFSEAYEVYDSHRELNKDYTEETVSTTDTASA